MNREQPSDQTTGTGDVRPPLLTSYDSGYEHSLEHWIEVQHLVHDADDICPPASAI